MIGRLSQRRAVQRLSGVVAGGGFKKIWLFTPSQLPTYDSSTGNYTFTITDNGLYDFLAVGGGGGSGVRYGWGAGGGGCFGKFKVPLAVGQKLLDLQSGYPGSGIDYNRGTQYGNPSYFPAGTGDGGPAGLTLPSGLVLRAGGGVAGWGGGDSPQDGKGGIATGGDVNFTGGEGGHGKAPSFPAGQPGTGPAPYPGTLGYDGGSSGQQYGYSGGGGAAGIVELPKGLLPSNVGQGAYGNQAGQYSTPPRGQPGALIILLRA